MSEPRRPAAPRDAIAVVGMACRFPGAQNTAAFWDLLRTGRDAIGEVPADRWDSRAFYDPDPQTADRMTTRWGGFVDAVGDFDADFFGVAPREAVSIARLGPRRSRKYDRRLARMQLVVPVPR